MLDINAIFKVTYGLYIVTSFQDTKHNGFIANTFCQVNSEPPTFQIIVSKNNYTHDMILKSNLFGVSVLAQDTPFKIIGLFGFKSGKDINKIEGLNIRISQSGVALILDYAIAYFVCKIFKTVDVNSHSIFIGNLIEAEILNDKAPLTYDYYRNVTKGKTSKNAPTYVKTNYLNKKEDVCMDKYVCEVCGYVYDPAVGDPDGGISPGTSFEDLPANWVCPVCGAGKDQFKKEA